jgi:hypothetical protein
MDGMKRSVINIGSLALITIVLYALFTSSRINASSLFSDGFETYSSFPSGGWIATTSSTWSVVTDGDSKVIKQISTSSPYIVVNGDNSWSNYTISARIKVDRVDTPRAGLLIRYKDNNNYYAAYIYSNYLYLDRRFNSNTRTLNTISFSYLPNTYYLFRVVADNTNIKVFVNNELKMAVADSSISNGKIGLYGTKATVYYNDLLVIDNNPGPDPTSVVTPTPTPTPVITPTPISTPTPTPTTGKYESGLNRDFEFPSPVSGRSLNVVDYGATSNNSNDDDAVAFREAIAAAKEGDEIYIPNGLYHIKTRKIELKTGVSIRGESSESTIISAMFNYVKDNPGSYIFGAMPGIGNLTLSKFHIEMSGGQALRYPIWLGAGNTDTNNSEYEEVYRIAVKNLIIEGFEKMGISVRNGRHILIKGNAIKNATATGGGGEGYGIMIGYDRSENNWITNNHIGPQIRHALVLQYRTHHNLVEYNVAENPTMDAYDLHGEDEYSNELRYNTAFGAGEGGFGVGNTGGTPEHYNSGPHNWIHHNEAYNCRYGIHIYRESHYQYVEDNNFHHNRDIGIYIHDAGANHVTLIGNRSQYNGAGARLENAADLWMENNIVTNNTGYVMKTNSGTVRYVIKDNNFRNNGSGVELGSTIGIFIDNLQ